MLYVKSKESFPCPPNYLASLVYHIIFLQFFKPLFLFCGSKVSGMLCRHSSLNVKSKESCSFPIIKLFLCTTLLSSVQCKIVKQHYRTGQSTCSSYDYLKVQQLALLTVHGVKLPRVELPVSPGLSILSLPPSACTNWLPFLKVELRFSTK